MKVLKKKKNLIGMMIEIFDFANNLNNMNNFPIIKNNIKNN